MSLKIINCVPHRGRYLTKKQVYDIGLKALYSMWSYPCGFQNICCFHCFCWNCFIVSLHKKIIVCFFINHIATLSKNLYILCSVAGPTNGNRRHAEDRCNDLCKWYSQTIISWHILCVSPYISYLSDNRPYQPFQKKSKHKHYIVTICLFYTSYSWILIEECLELDSFAH